MSEVSSEVAADILDSKNVDSAQETGEEETDQCETGTAASDDVAADSIDSESLHRMTSEEAGDPPSSPKTADSSESHSYYDEKCGEATMSGDEADGGSITADDSSVPDDGSAVRLDPQKLICVRKDLFPKVRLPKLVPAIPDAYTMRGENVSTLSCVKLDTDFEQSIDDTIRRRKRKSCNGIIEPERHIVMRPRKHRSDGDPSIQNTNSNVLEDYKKNGCLPPETKRRKSMKHKKSRSRKSVSKVIVPHHTKGGKNMNNLQCNLVYDMDDDDDDDSNESFDSVDNMALLPSSVPKSGKPFSHQMSQLAFESKRAQSMRILPIIPSGGKPRSMMGISSSSNKKKSKQKKSPTYQSQISVDTNTIKIRIKKSSSHSQLETKSIADVGHSRTSSKRKKPKTPSPSSSSGEEYDPSHGDLSTFNTTVSKPRPTRRAAQQQLHQSCKKLEIESHAPRQRSSHGSSSSSSGRQSPWGREMPPEVLSNIFEYVVYHHGALPTVIRLGMVCRLWRVASFAPKLWKLVELAPHTKEIWKTDYKLAWLLENRLTKCQQLNLSNWKVSNLTWICACIVEYSPLLRELNLTGWKRLSAENLKEIVDGLCHLQRIDLSFTSDTGSSGSCLSTSSLTYLTQTMAARLTHLTLANNKFTGLTQILNSLALHCPSLELLDISGVLAASHPASIPLERLQKGCPKLRVLRAANSQLVLATATTIEQMESPGFSCLEELSVACPSSDYKFIDDDALGRLLKSSTALRLLDVRGCIRITDSGLVRVPAWDLQHLFLSGCSVTRQKNSCLELICEKWAHSLMEVDLQWATATRPLDSAVESLAEKGEQSRLKILNLCGSSVSLEPVKKILFKCPKLESLNLSSCRALPRGMKRLYTGKELQDLKDSFDPVKVKEKEELKKRSKDGKRKSQETMEDEDESKPNVKELKVSENTIDSNQTCEEGFEGEAATKDANVTEESLLSPQDPEVAKLGVVDKIPVVLIKEQCSIESLESVESEKGDKSICSPQSKDEGPKSNQSSIPPEASPKLTPKNWNLEQFSPAGSTAADSSVQNKLEPSRSSGWQLEQFSTMPKPDSQQITQMSPEAVKQDPSKVTGSWNLNQFNMIKQDLQNYSQASPDTRHVSAIEGQKGAGNWNLDQFSPVAQKGSPETLKQETQKPGNWNIGPYSPMTRQEGQYSAQPSPYSAQPSPAQPSPYSAQPSPYSAQPSPYSAQPSPDTSQTVKQDPPKSSWNLGQFSPMAKQINQYSSQQSPDTGNASKDKIGASWNLGPFSPMARQDGQYASQQSPYSPRPSPEMSKQDNQKQSSARTSKSDQYSSQRSPSVGKFSPMVRPDCSIPGQPSPDTGQMTSRSGRSWNRSGQFSPMAAPAAMPSPDTSTGKVNMGWNLGGPFSPASPVGVSNSDSAQVQKPNQMWNVGHYGAIPPKADSCPTISHSVPEPHHFSAKSNQGQWNYGQSAYDALADLQRHMDTGQTMSKVSDSWSLGQFNLGQTGSGVSAHSNFSMSSSVNAQCAWSDGGGYANSALIPTTVQGVCVKGDKDRTGYGVMDSGNHPVATSCAVSQISGMLQTPMEPLNGPSRID